MPRIASPGSDRSRTCGGTDLVLTDAGKRYGRHRWVLRHVNLTVAPGQLLHVVGANGSGKSTLLRLIAGVSRLSAGHAVRPGVRRYVPDRAAMAARLRAGEYVMAMGRVQGVAAHDLERRVRRLLGQMDFAGGWHQQVSRLSKGNARKLSICQAFLSPADLIVLDEPWTDLDATATSGLLQLLTDSREQGSMIVLTDHSENAERLTPTAAHHNAHLHDGVLTDRSPHDQIIDVRLRALDSHADTDLRALRLTLDSVLASAWTVDSISAATTARQGPQR